MENLNLEDLKLVLPHYRIENNSKTIFLAGPVNGAPLWQDKAIEIISKKDKNILIASPSIRVRQEYYKNQLRSERFFSSGLCWERFYLEQASKNGCILFWLANQISEMPIDKNTGFHKPYARDTRGELGEWRGRMLNEKVNIVIGNEKYFPGLDVIQRNFLEIKQDIKFYDSLEETCNEVIRISNT